MHSAENNIKSRLIAIDALRGLVIVFMLLDHVRDTMFLHQQVSDPVNVLETSGALFFARLLSSYCAPIFVFLTGLSAWLYGQGKEKGQIAGFLLKRGLFLVILEVTIINFAWTGQLPPKMIYLQVIWCIGLSMIALAALLYAPRLLQIIIAGALIAGHNMLETLVMQPGDALYEIWAVLYQRSVIELTADMSARTSYPVLPWIGIILSGYLIGPLFGQNTDAETRNSAIFKYSVVALVAFLVIRSINVYGDQPWFLSDNPSITFMSFLALTKYPPSLLFILFTMGFGGLFYLVIDRFQSSKLVEKLSHFGAAPLFFYVIHLYVIRLLYLAGYSYFGPTQGKYFALPSVTYLWLVFLILLVPLYFPTKWFAGVKARNKHRKWLSYL